MMARIKLNRIDYIVQSDPAKTNQILKQYGFEPIYHRNHLAQAIRQLIREKGRVVIRDLLLIHPDRKAILRLEKPKQSILCASCKKKVDEEQDDQYCSTCSEANFLDSHEKGVKEQLSELSKPELKQIFNRMLNESNADPGNKQKDEMMQVVWNELRKREGKEDDSETTPKKAWEFRLSWKELGLSLAIVLIAGYFWGNKERPITSHSTA